MYITFGGDFVSLFLTRILFIDTYFSSAPSLIMWCICSSTILSILCRNNFLVNKMVDTATTFLRWHVQEFTQNQFKIQVASDFWNLFQRYNASNSLQNFKIINQALLLQQVSFTLSNEQKLHCCTQWVQVGIVPNTEVHIVTILHILNGWWI
jgi:hypothetical protein